MGSSAIRRLFIVLLVVSAVGPARLGAEEWYDAYAAGVAALNRKDPAKAVEWLERAARKHPEPGRNLLTYGTNRLEVYHPYLRLAEAHLLGGNLDAAAAALASSQTRGKEPPEERSRLLAQVTAGRERVAAAASTPPPTAAPTAPPTVPPTSAPALSTPALVVAAPTSAAAAPRPAGGILEVRSNPEGATVLLADRLVGTTPLRLDLPAGSYDVTLRKEGTAELRFPVRVEAGARTFESRDLVTAEAVASPAPPPAIASLVVYSDPPGASVYLDDEPLGVTDPATGRLVKSGVAPGPHRVRLTRDGWSDSAEDITVAESGPTTVRRVLDRASPAAALYGAAAALLLAGATVYFLYRRRAASTLAPGETPATALAGLTASPTPAAGRATHRSPATLADATLAEATLELPRATPRATAHLGAVGSTFGDYRLIESLGKGGMATVYKVERRGELCALKRPLAGFLEDADFMERFLREADLGHTLHHPNIIRIFERGNVDGIPFFTMELVEGETLQTRVKRQGTLTPRSATEIVVQVAEALDYAHLKGVVHRDLKPSNIMISKDGAVKVMDYGIARARKFEGLTATGAFLGTPDYVAPETAEGTGSDARSDLYSLGIVYYELVTGRRPFDADTPFATLRKHCTEPPPPPRTINDSVPAEIETIILRLLNKAPADRYPGAEELLVALRSYLNRAA